MKLIVLDDKNGITAAEANALTESVGWGKSYYKTDKVWQKILTSSSYIAYIKKEDTLIAFGRILEDGLMCMFYDICVHPEYQNKGIGSLLMNHLINKVKDEEYVSLGLFVWSGNETASAFYSKFGFEKVYAMELKKFMKHV